MTISDVKDMFRYHPANADTNTKYEAIRKAGEELARTIVDLSPPGCDQTAAVTSIHVGVMLANSLISRYGR